MKNIVGQQFNFLKVLSIHHKKQIYLSNGTKNGFRYYYECKCICGNKCIVEGRHLIAGHTKSCGCLTIKHNLTNTRLFRIWSGILNRCYNPNNQKYKNYGALGIIVCEDWRTEYINFYHWAISHGYNDNLTIDRINVKGSYEPSNCRWVDQKKQQNNRNNNHFLTYKGETHTISEWAEITGINYFTLKTRVYLKWSPERCLTTPVRQVRNLR